MKKLVAILVIIFAATITVGCSRVTASVDGDCVTASVSDGFDGGERGEEFDTEEQASVSGDDAELSVGTDYKYAVVEADEGTGIPWEDLYIYEIQGYVRNGRDLTLVFADGTTRVEDGNEYFLCRTEADLWKLLIFLDDLNEQL